MALYVVPVVLGALVVVVIRRRGLDLLVTMAAGANGGK
jgi:hypothetical protein